MSLACAGCVQELLRLEEQRLNPLPLATALTIEYMRGNSGLEA